MELQGACLLCLCYRDKERGGGGGGKGRRQPPKLKLKDYTVRLPRASRDQDMKLLRRAARDIEGVGESDPVYPLTGPACITRKEAAAALLALGEERDDAMVAAAKAAVSESGDCGEGARSTIADGSIPLAMGINQPLLAEAEADARLASPGVSRNLTTEDQRSSLPHPAQLYHAQGKPDSSDDATGAMSAAAKIAPARAGDVAGLAAVAAAKVFSRGAAEGEPVLKRSLATAVANDIANSMEVAGGGGKCSFGKRKRGHDDNDDDDDMVDGSGCVDVNKASGDDGASERCAKRVRQAAGGQSRQLRGSRDRSGK
ncbi:hypothetical protein Esi_0129_0065 [Ectocarpus siliculosus]|uniref:Uncharacterized protein n=1 Tax=Ectocarpus siliculosus TaxID=2880 RepID=D8LE40_ECTSI|nr:hypothetical protein Esi_0129_0065 [Ectocarpus siliculosus]|eukprot:CBN78557.1 hypothetical protein Esi_0129_0065 [Ectocarpus siliculosus]